MYPKTVQVMNYAAAEARHPRSRKSSVASYLCLCNGMNSRQRDSGVRPLTGSITPRICRRFYYSAWLRLAAAHRAIAQPFTNKRLEKRNLYPLYTTLDDSTDLSICPVPISKPCKVIATFWEGTGDSINVNSPLDGGFKKFPDARSTFCLF